MHNEKSASITRGKARILVLVDIKSANLFIDIPAHMEHVLTSCVGCSVEHSKLSRQTKNKYPLSTEITLVSGYVVSLLYTRQRFLAQTQK